MEKWFVLLMLLLSASVATGAVAPPTVVTTLKSDDVITKAPWVDARVFANLSAAKASPSTAGKTILVATTQSCNNLTIPSDRSIRVIRGGSINVATGKKLTLVGTIEAGRYQIFTGAGQVFYTSGSSEGVMPEWYGSTAAAFQAAAYDIDRSYTGTNKPPVFSLGAKIYVVSGVSHSTGVYYKGAGSGQTIIQHADGYAEPLIRLSGGESPAAFPWFGFQGITFKGGNQTTALLYFTGSIDNQVKFHDLQFSGVGTNTGMDGISVQNYLNWSLDQVRWDQIGGWAIKVRTADSFGNSYMHITHFSYDNEVAGASSFGNGFFYQDTTALSTFKATINLAHGRMEVNTPLNGSFPSRGLIRILQNSSYAVSNGNTTMRIAMDNVVVDGNGANDTNLNGAHFKMISVDNGELQLDLRDTELYGMDEIFNNDAGNAKTALRIDMVSGARVNRATAIGSQFGKTQAKHIETWGGSNVHYGAADSHMDFQYFNTGDIFNYLSPTGTGGHLGRPFAFKAVQTAAGFHHATGSTPTQTGSITAGTATLTLSADFSTTSSIVMGAAITVAGAGASGATLTAKIVDIDYTAHTLTLSTTASTTVSGAALSIPKAQMMAVDMVFYGTAVPTSGTYATGDKLINVDTTYNGYSRVQEWTCLNGGTPGTWRATKWITGKSSTGNRPTLTANDIGVMYLDTTLAANGLPIWWNGTAWVDSAGGVR